MSKVNRAYPHLMGGVSQEPQEKRGAGEHQGQDNMVSDPVRGLTRRAGAQFLDHATNASSAADSGDGTRTYDFQVGDQFYSVVYDTAAAGMNRVVVFSKSTGTIVPVTHAADANVTALLAGGITSATSLGRYVVMAGPGLAPVYTTTEKYGVEANLKYHIVWIRGGAFSRRYRMALVRGNQKLWCEYTTPSSGYPEPLDTSGLNVNDPDYLKQVNDLTNQYNSAVNAWIAAALEASQPDNIASTLAEEVTNSGFLASGETCTSEGPNIVLTAPTVEDVEIDDGGDGSLARGVGNTVAAAELLSLSHIPGKIVRVRPNNSTEGQCFYMEAVAKDGSTGQLTEVSWRECAGTEFTPTVVFGVLAVNDEGTAAYFDTDMEDLQATEPEFSTLPSYSPSAAGDLDSNPPQRFLGEAATGLTTFQDRLVVLCNNSVNSSKTSDYFNFFRASIVTVAANDPVNFVTIGGEDDVLRYALTYDRNLVLWGTGQYIVDGRKPFIPGSVSSVRMASIPDSLVAAPALADRFMFYGKTRSNGTGTVHHLQPGRIQEAPETFELSRRLKNYILGDPTEIKIANDPDYLYIRSTGDNHLKTFAYQDAANGERIQAAWSRWTFNTALGELLGVSIHDGAVYLLFSKFEASTTDHMILLRVAQTAGDEPFLDAWAEEDDVDFPAILTSTVEAYGRTGGYAGGDATPDAGTLYKGYLCPSRVNLTSPFATDRDGIPILNGRTVVNSVKVWTEDTSGFQWGLRAQGQPDGMGAWVVPTGTLYAPPESRLIYDSFTGAAGVTLGDHNGEAGADWSRWFTLGADVSGYELDGAGGLRGTGTMRDGYFKGSAFPAAGSAGSYSIDFTVASFNVAPTTPTVSVFAASDSTVTGVVGRFGFLVGTEQYAGSFKVFIHARTDGFPSSPNFLDVDTGVNSLGAHSLRVDVPAARDRLLVAFDGVTIYDQPLPQPMGPFAVAGFGYATADEAAAQWTINSVGVLETPPFSGPLWAETSGVVAGNLYGYSESDPVNDLNGVDPNGNTFVNGEYVASNAIAGTASIASLAPYEHASASIPVGRETREYRLTLESYLWAPLTIKAVEWVGQLLYRARRL